MLVKNILAVFAIAGMAAAYPAEGVETDLEERGNYCEKDSNSWCCKNIVPFSILFFDGVGSGCKHPGNDGCKYSSPLCCHKGQIVSNGQDGSQVVCLKK